MCLCGQLCLFVCLFVDCLGVKEQHRVDLFDGEEEMLRRYKFHMELKEKFLNLERGSSFMTLVDQAEGEQQLKVGGCGSGRGKRLECASMRD